jgi:hypothetical protein
VRGGKACPVSAYFPIGDTILRLLKAAWGIIRTNDS